ncbi:MAG: CRISPR-associated endonuclease Cas2 [Patescibacteria group bacterium]
MGKLEESNKRRAQKGEIQKLVLQAVKLVGVLSIGLVAPNVIGAMHKLGLITNKRQGEIANSSASKLAKKGLLKFNGRYYELTLMGEEKLRHLGLDDYKLKKPKKWDRKWRVVIFDISEKKKKIRHHIRSLLEKMGFYRLQDSVWVYPYDCEDFIGLLKTELGVGKEVLYLIVDEIEGDKYLREKFNLL